MNTVEQRWQARKPYATLDRSYIIRTSWVYGSGKNSFLSTVHKDLRAGKSVRAILDIWSSTTYVEDLIQQVLRILNKRRYGTYHIVNEGVCSYYEFAMEAGRLVGLIENNSTLLSKSSKKPR